jgi:Cu-processing system ATP-binding protein
MIRISGLTKRFGALPVLQGIEAEFRRGRVTGIVGPNAAGKTTLIKTILGLTRADSGSIHVDGVRVNGDETYRRDIGYMPQIARFPSSLTGKELLAMLRGLRGNPRETDESLIDVFGIRGDLDRKLNNLSGGTKQKINAVAAFLFDPRVLILDEPTAGLDPRSSAVLKDYIVAGRTRGKTFIITSHIMSELQEIADDLILISDGRTQFSGSVEEAIAITRQVNLERAVAELMERGKAA